MRTKKILIVRNDKLGDFVLSLPVYKLIKRNCADIKIRVLVPEYTSEIAKSCKYIDHIIIDPTSTGSFKSQINLLNILRKENYSAVITLFSTLRIGILVWLAKIPYRLAPATKIAQIFYNHHIKQRRSKSLKPEQQKRGFTRVMRTYNLNRYDVGRWAG